MKCKLILTHIFVLTVLATSLGNTYYTLDREYRYFQNNLFEDGTPSFTFERAIYNQCVLQLLYSPASEILYINYALTTMHVSAVMQVFNVSGSLIREVELNRSEGTLTLGLAHFPKGEYSILVQDKNRNLATQTFIKY